MRNLDPTAALFERLQGGDPRAAEELFSRYSRQLIQLAERHLSRRVAGREDGEDVVQSAFRTFFRRSADGEFRINNSAQIWRLLVQITLRKARAKGRRHTAGPRDVRVETDGGQAWLGVVVTEEPGPVEAAVLVDQIEALLRDCPPLYGDVLKLRLAGGSVAEIAPRLGVSRQTIYRVLHALQQRLDKMSDADR